MKLASTRIALLTMVLGATGALSALPLGNGAAANGLGDAVAHAVGGVGASAGIGGSSANAGASSGTEANASSSRNASGKVDGLHVANSTDADVSVTGPNGGSVDVGVDSNKAASLYRFGAAGNQATGALAGSTGADVGLVDANGNSISEELAQSGSDRAHVGQFHDGTILGAKANNVTDSDLLATTAGGSSAAADAASDANGEAHGVIRSSK